MLRLLRAVVVAGLFCAANAQTTTSERVLSTLNPQIDAAPSLTPTIYDPSAPDPQDCPGYKASNVQESQNGFTADLTIAGPNCQAYGNDIADLTLEMQYQSKDRLSLKIYPKYISDSNQTEYFLSPQLVPEPESDGQTTNQTSHLGFAWSNEPSFQFRVFRTRTGEELFSTYGHVIVFEDQFLELATNMVEDYNVYGLAENIHDFYLGNNYTQTFYAVDAGNTVDGNVYGTYPFYQETRYNTNGTTAHGVYARNSHGQEWLLRDNNITYRTLGGTFDLYFLSGEQEDGSSSALQTIRQFQVDCSGTPAMQQFWTFGFHQSRWGYQNISVMRGIVAGYKDADIPLETLWNDIDIYSYYKDFTNDNNTFPSAGMIEWISELHANNQYYVPIVDSNTYVPNPDNASDAYPPWTRAAEQGLFIRDPSTGGFYYGDGWPGFSSWGDWLLQGSRDWWSYELTEWHGKVPFDGIWIDLSEASSFCVDSCGNGRITEDPVAPPFLLPGEPGDNDYLYPEAFNITNATEAASASAAEASQASSTSATPPLPVPTTTTRGRTEPTPGVRNLYYPPYVINNVQTGHALPVHAIAPNATHNDPSNTTEYAIHNLFGLGISNATYHALLNIFPGKRPFTIGRSTFVSSGRVTGHWGGDNTSTWGSMFLSISQALTFMMSGLPMFGPDTCGFSDNTDFELCSRWMELSAFFPFYRNHNTKATISQEAFRWSSVAEASRRAMKVRYSLLNYMYTLFYYAHTRGDTVMRALAWEFPEDESLKETFAQFLLGPSILVTPVLEPLVTTVNGVFPGIGEGTRWYDWYTLAEVQAKPQENVTMQAELEHINVHIRGGSILPLQEPGLTTAAVRNGTWSLLIALDDNQFAKGSLYLDDGVSLVPESSTLVDFVYDRGLLLARVNGTYRSTAPLGNITIVGIQEEVKGMGMSMAGQECEVGEVGMEQGGGVVKMWGLEKFSGKGAWEGEMSVRMGF